VRREYQYFCEKEKGMIVYGISFGKIFCMYFGI